MLPVTGEGGGGVVIGEGQLGNGATATGHGCGSAIFHVLFSSEGGLLSLCGKVGRASCASTTRLRVIALRGTVCVKVGGSLTFVVGAGLFLCRRRSACGPGVPLESLFCVSDRCRGVIS